MCCCYCTGRSILAKKNTLFLNGLYCLFVLHNGLHKSNTTIICMLKVSYCKQHIITPNSIQSASTMLPNTVIRSKMFHGSLKKFYKTNGYILFKVELFVLYHFISQLHYFAFVCFCCLFL